MLDLHRRLEVGGRLVLVISGYGDEEQLGAGKDEAHGVENKV
jgi:hypothetical protein